MYAPASDQERGRAVSKIDDYLATVTGAKRTELDKLRKTIRSIVPQAEECISYGMPAFRVDGSVIAGFQATAKGCSYYPFSGTTLQTLAGDLHGYGRVGGQKGGAASKAWPVPCVPKPKPFGPSSGAVTAVQSGVSGPTPSIDPVHGRG